MEECIVAAMAESHAVYQQTEEAGFVETVAHFSVEPSQSSLQDILLPLPTVEYGIQRVISVGRHTDIQSQTSAYTTYRRIREKTNFCHLLHIIIVKLGNFGT